MKKKVFVYTIADKNNLEYAHMLEKTFKHFHKNIPFHIITGTELEEYTKQDPYFFYRATPILSEKYLEEYECVLKLDADQLVLGDMSYIWDTTDYDLATVMNWNRIDPRTYGEVQGWGILPPEYFNCGLVALRSSKLAHHWKVLCFSEQFNRLQYKEQDLMNILCYYGNYNIRCLDHGDGLAGVNAWWGLIAKGELLRAELRDDTVVIPKAEDNFPPVDMPLKVVHFAGGQNNKTKMNYRLFFNDDDVCQHITKLLK
jgi:hypothetical protein